MALTDELPTLGDDPANLLDSITNFGLAFAPEESSIFSGIPAVDLGADVAPQAPDVAAPQVDAGGIKEAAGIGGNRNSAQRWQVQAQQPVPNVQEVQQANRMALDPRSGGSTSRYYTRKLARMILGDRHASDVSKEEARMSLRFEGAPKFATGADRMGPPSSENFAQQSRPYGPSSKDDWQKAFQPPRETGEVLPPPVTGGNWSSMFKDTRANEFGASGKGLVFNPTTGQMEQKPSGQSALRSITEEVLRLSQSIRNPAV